MQPVIKQTLTVFFASWRDQFSQRLVQSLSIFSGQERDRWIIGRHFVWQPFNR